MKRKTAEIELADPYIIRLCRTIQHLPFSESHPDAVRRIERYTWALIADYLSRLPPLNNQKQT